MNDFPSETRLNVHKQCSSRKDWKPFVDFFYNNKITYEGF